MQTTTQRLAAARERALGTLAALKRKHPSLKAHLVFAAVPDQTPIDSDLTTIVAEVPTLFVAGPKRVEAQRLVQSLGLVKKRDDREHLVAAVPAAVDAMELDAAATVELRFDELRYEVVWAVQADPLVDLERTPQTRLSIQIVLGTVLSLAGGT